MKNIAFVIWMMGWIFLADVSNKFLQVEIYSSDVRTGSALLTFIIWIFVGWLLYEKKAN